MGEIDERKVRDAGLKVIRLFKEIGLDPMEEIVCLADLLETSKKALVLTVILGEKGMSTLMKGVASDFIEEAEKILKEEE